MFFILPILTFFFTLSVLSIIKFLINLFRLTYSDPPKKYDFNKYEPTFYLVLISYIITFLIYI